MTASIRTLGTFTIGLAALATIPATPLATPINASAAFDGSAARRCAISTITQCDGTGLWQRHTGSWRPDLPSLLRVNVGQWLITDGQDSGRKTEMTSAARLDGRVIVYVDEHGRGRVATIAEVTGQMSADGPTSPVCGACPSP